jgi:DNA-binding CsgD family transcriptional regulator
LTELGSDGSASGGLRRSVAARLRDLDQPARRAFLLIALAAAPLREEIVEPGALATLRRSGLVIEEEPGRLSPRHALLGELAVAETTDTERALVHALLARVVETDAEAARHHAAAGEVGLAHTAALRAAEDAATPGERAGHLRLAAATAQGDGAEALRLQAAYALADGYEWEAAEEILADIGPDADAEVRARAWLQRARGAWARGAADEIERDIREGLAACAGQDGDTDVLLRIESSRLPLFVRYEFETQIPVTAAHVAEARERGVGIARALYYHGTALAVSGRAEGFEVLAAAVDAATADGDLDTEFTAANNLISFHESDGDPDTGRAFAQRMRDRAHALGLGRWETSMRYQTAQLDFHAGRCSAALAETTDLLGLPLDPRTRDSVREVHGMSLVDVGRIEDADRLAVPWMAEAVDDQQGASQFLWVRAEAALCGGRPADALAHMDEFLRGAEPDPNLAFGWITRAWARWEMGIDPGPHLENPGRRMIDAVEPEGRGIRLLFEGRNSEAAVEFAHAATLWRPYHRRGAVRSAWAHGEALRRAGDLDAAVAALEEAEREAEAFGYAVQAARTRHSLNLSGQRRQASRGRRTGGLTAREADVLELVAEGLTNAQIAGRLGVSVRTVLTQIDSASARIGAVSRAQAAALYRALRAGEPGEAE